MVTGQAGAICDACVEAAVATIKERRQSADGPGEA